mmetsp:Transcript_36104/g.75884  ORF Transcript_36104/g.75884 Transcript_36104/m.75884 type:complete len:334 (+) Transcript_36104:34-1035(+)
MGSMLSISERIIYKLLLPALALFRLQRIHLLLPCPRRTFSHPRIQLQLPQPHAQWRHLDHLVLVHVPDQLLNTHPLGRTQVHLLFLALRPHIIHLLRTYRVHLQVTRLGILPDDHAGIHHVPRSDEQRSTRRERFQSEQRGLPHGVADQPPTIRSTADDARMFSILQVTVMHHRRTSRHGGNLGSEAQQPATGHLELHPRFSSRIVAHFDQHSPPRSGQRVHHRSGILRVHVDDHLLVRLELDARLRTLRRQYLRRGDDHLVPLPSHLLHQNPDLQLPPSQHDRLLRVRLAQLHGQRHVIVRLADEAGAHPTRGDVRALLPAQRAVVRAEEAG